MKNSYLILSNLFYISIAFIPFIILHCFLFKSRMNMKKLLFSIASAVIILPVIAFFCFLASFKHYEYLKDILFVGYCLLYIFAYMGLIAFNYLIFFIINLKDNKVKAVKYIPAFLVLFLILYLSVPTYLAFVSTITNTKQGAFLSQAAVKLSVFPCTKKVLELIAFKII